MARPFVAGNWKMNLTSDEAVHLVRALRTSIGSMGGVTCVVCPPFVTLEAVAEELQDTEIQVGAQNMHPDVKGAFTGEVSVSMLKDICDYVIVGHSERRHVFGESDDFINRKVVAALDWGLTPILCVGETTDEHETGSAREVCRLQLLAGLSGIEQTDVARVVVAYEPVWAIGTGNFATPELAQHMMRALRAEITGISPGAGFKVPLLYGGSVTPDNASDFARESDIDGALVGGASLNAEKFAAIVGAFA